MKIVNKIKNYHPNKYIWYLLFFIPIFVGVITRMDKENDIFFLLRYGEQILNFGFPTTDFLSMHQDFSFVMQQWLSSVIFYLSYHFLGHYGLILIVNLVNLIILYMLYQFCMLLSDHNYKISILLACIADLLLETGFIIPRPQIFDFLNLLLVLYIMEMFYRKKSNKILFLLPIISFLQINLHASVWFMLFLFMLPFVVNFLICKIVDQSDNRIFQVLGIIVVMLLVGIANPYGIENITYIFSSYGVKYINELVIEMLPPVLNVEYSVYGILTFTIMACVLTVYIEYKKEKISLRYALLLLGVTVLALSHIRNYSLYIIGAIPPLALYLKKVLKKDYNKQVIDESYKRYYKKIVMILGVYLVGMTFLFNNKFTNELEKGVDYLLDHYKREDIVLYTDYNNGSYCEFRGLKPYIDTRAEVFLKANNKKENILKEYYLLENGLLDYQKFLDKYKFTHLIISKTDTLYPIVSQDKNYKTIYREDSYSIFERKNR